MNSLSSFANAMPSSLFLSSSSFLPYATTTRNLHPRSSPHCHSRSHSFRIMSSSDYKPASTKPTSWVSPDWLINLTRSLTIGKNGDSNIPIASAKLEDVSDLLAGALFLPLFKWMNEYGPIYRLAARPRNFVIVSDPAIAKHVLRNYGKYAKGLVSEVSEFFFGSGFAIAEGPPFGRCAERLVEKLRADAINGSAINMEEKFSQVATNP